MLQQRLSRVVLSVLSLSGLAFAQKPAISYCSSDNNAGLYSPISNEFMTTGLCADNCRGSYAMAIVKGNQCWCSNYAPTNQVDTLECNSGCPGSSDEWCGNTDEGLYGYFQLRLGTALGTSGGPESAAPSTTSSSDSSTNSPPAPSPTSATPSIVTSYITTGAGPPSTVLVTQTPVPSEDSLGQSATSGSKGGLSGGAIAGIVIGVIALALIAALAAWFFCWRRRKQEQSRHSSFSASRIGGTSSTVPTSNSVPSRQVSQMSQAGLLGSKAPRINTTGLGGGLGLDARSPDGGNSAVDRRSLGTDQRLNPWAIYKADEDDHASLADDRDYSRQLRVANPDD